MDYYFSNRLKKYYHGIEQDKYTRGPKARVQKTRVARRATRLACILKISISLKAKKNYFAILQVEYD